MREIDCLLIGHYALDVATQIQLAEGAFGRNSPYYYDALEKTFLLYKNKKYTSSQLYNLFYANGAGDLSFDHVTFEHSFNTAIANIGTYLLRQGFSVEFVNTFNKGRQVLPALLTENRVWLVAIPTTFYITGFPIARVVSFVRKHNPAAKIVVGGPFIRTVVAGIQDQPAELNTLFTKLGADYYVYNTEGEETLGRLIMAVKRDEPLETVPNLYYRNGAGFGYTYSKLENNAFAQPATDWEYFKDSIPQLVNIRTTKSCPFDCAFCGLPVAGGKWRHVPVAELELELKALRASGGHPGIFFIDETLNFPMKRFKEILRMMIRNDFGFKWEAEMRCDILDSEAVELMVESGCQLVHLGIESGSQRMLDNMSKRVKLEDYRRAMGLLHEHGVFTSALILVGFPGETPDTFRETVDFIETEQPTLFRVHRWFYDHETPVHKNSHEYQVTGSGYTWTHYTMDSLTAHELSTELSMSIRNSIHTDDYTMAFYLLSRDYPKPKVHRFLKLFDEAIKAKCRAGASAVGEIDGLVDQMKTALN
jgi:anaerobic magnesium-protoporphyrin IX monomethyl ester cyclase